MKVVILAAGRSTRAVPLTLTRPKPLLPIANKTILEHQLDALHGLIDGAVLVVGYLEEMIRDHMGDSYRGIHIDYVVQKEQLGTGHALLQCKDFIDGPFIAMNGDDLYDPADLTRLAQEEQASLSIEIEDPRSFGVYEVNDDLEVIRLEEKPEKPASNLANAGVYKFTPRVFDVLEETKLSSRGEIELTSAIQTIAESSVFRVVKAEGHWLPIGYAWDLLTANEYLLKHFLETNIDGEVHSAADVSGPLALGKGSVIRSGVVIEGPVCIGENSVIGPNAYLRPGTTIGNGCKVGQACELKNTILFDGAQVPHLSYIGDTVIGANSNLGAGTITANLRHDNKNIRTVIKKDIIDTGRRKFGAIIGDNVHTGINTSILPGRKLWPNTGTWPGAVVKKDVTE
jgi:bifunctional UDP-N-acetylglucosamine pyrophosphorylase/glucosamine-1-phosphate N-acetyltransferase